MAEGHTISRLANVENIQSINEDNMIKEEKASFLFKKDYFVWNGDFNSLKALVEALIKCESGKWSSPGGEAKMFKSKNFSIKWYGPKKRKLIIVEDNEEELLRNTLGTYAHEIKSETHNENLKISKHVANGIEDKQPEQKPSDAIDSASESNEHYKRQITDMFTIIADIKQKQQEESQKFESKLTNLAATMETLAIENSKMAAEIESLKSTITDLRCENQTIKCVLDIKQDMWSKVEGKKSNKETKSSGNVNKCPVTQNQFEVLNVEDSPQLSSTLEEENSAAVIQSSENPNTLDMQLDDYRKNQKYKFDKTCRKAKNGNLKESNTKPANPENAEKTVLVIGDSMVKHIDAKKIAKAARCKAVSHSYSGATIHQLTEKFTDEIEKQKYHTVILHVGTNDLTHDNPEKAASNMENLINKVKSSTMNIAVSGVIKRYDGKVNNNIIYHYNKLIHSICAKQNIAFIDNSCIDKPLLNRPNLHLNREGDRTLGSAFCNYLKSIRIRKPNVLLNTQAENFFWPVYGRRKEWTTHLKTVRNMIKN